MQKIEFQDLPDTSTPLSASNLNDLQDNVEEAINKINNYLNLSNSESITSGTITGGGTLSNVNITIAKNSDGTLAKMYGQIDIDTAAHVGNAVFQTSLRPTNSLTINGVAYRSISNSSYVRNNAIISITLETDGRLIIPYVYSVDTNDSCRISLIGCLISIKNLV